MIPDVFDTLRQVDNLLQTEFMPSITGRKLTEAGIRSYCRLNLVDLVS